MSENLLGELLQRAAFDNLRFPVTECTQTGARQVTEHEAWRRDGAELVDGGRKAFRGKITAAFFGNIEGYGDDLFPGTFESLLTRFYSDGAGRLSHPLLGTFDVLVASWEPRISAKARNGAFVDFEWIEQRASSVGVIALLPDRGAGDPRTELAARAAAADAALGLVGVALEVPLATVTTSALATVATPVPYAAVGKSLASVDVTVDAARLRLDAVRVTGANAVAVWSARAALMKVLSSTGRVRAALLPDPSRATVYQLPRAMTLAEVSLAVYGSPWRAADLRAANALAADVVPVGRTLTVLP